MLEDRILIWKARRGDRLAFDRIYHRYLDPMLSVAMALLHDRSEAEEVVQDVFVSFVGSLDGFELRGNLKAFLATCVANRSRDRIRHETRKAALDLPPSEVTGDAPDPIEQAIQSEQVQRVQAALAQLPYEQREVIALHIHGGLTFRAMARTLECPLGTVQARYRYGIDKLRVLLNSEVHE
jgi:RNA polymerase sigma-70 factor, ECF subfamily